MQKGKITLVKNCLISDDSPIRIKPFKRGELVGIDVSGLN